MTITVYVSRDAAARSPPPESTSAHLSRGACRGGGDVDAIGVDLIAFISRGADGDVLLNDRIVNQLALAALIIFAHFLGIAAFGLAGFLRRGADLLITEGQAGGLFIRVGDEGARDAYRYLPTATDRETDPTGAGDTFLAALLASVLRPAIVGRSRSRRSPDLRFAAAAGSLAVEGPGLSAVPDRAAVLVRRARERVRRAVIPSEVSQVGAVEG